MGTHLPEMIVTAVTSAGQDSELANVASRCTFGR
jgi:hypothetical protein